MRIYSIAYGHTQEHADSLRSGLSKLPDGFAARICGACDGKGEYKQTYTAGCGMGYYQSLGVCDNCDGTGLMQGHKPAPDSVREQVLNAAA